LRTLAAMVAIAIAAAGCGPEAASRAASAHPDGAGILASEGAPDAGWQFAIAADQTPASETFGLRLCVMDGTSAPVLESVSALATVGAPPELLGTSLRTFRPSDTNTPIIGAVGYPPAVPDTLVPAVGATITSSCETPDSYTELLIGLAPESGKGGGWTGESIGYAVDDRHYTLSLENHLVFCGPGLDHPSC
jgi:hypothetical protein